MSNLISRADAIEAVRNLMRNEDDWYIEAFAKAINALPSAEAEFADLPDIPRAYYERIVGNMAHEINTLKGQLESADAVQVVRCKDCRHGEHIQIPLWENRDIEKAPSQFHDFIKCHKFHIKGFNETLYLGDDDFCSYGERK